MAVQNIRELVHVTDRPTVIRLDDLQADSEWISTTYFRTAEVEAHLTALRHCFAKEHGRGVFVIGHYGSGKSHFLAYLIQQVRAGNLIDRRAPLVHELSLLNYRSDLSLEQILEEHLGIHSGAQDRRERWSQLDAPDGCVLIIDELSEFLRSKPSQRSFTEDVRFLQFLGERSQGAPFWVIAAMQEQIERTGELESSLYRKIKDRFPLRLMLTPQHVRDLLAESILEKADGYDDAVKALISDLEASLPKSDLDFEALTRLYPLHPLTIELLEEVRELFSETRGIVDFTVTQLLGNQARGIEAFLDRPWGDLLTPDSIIDHFIDLFEVHPEFLPLAQKFLPYYRQRIPELFPSPAQTALAWRLLKLLILVHISPTRKELDADRASQWLLFRASRIAADKNTQILDKMLHTLAREGRYITHRDRAFGVDLDDNSHAQLEGLVQRRLGEVADMSVDAVWDLLVSSLSEEHFNPFGLPSSRWQKRKLTWYQHDRDFAVILTDEQPPSAQGSTALCIRTPMRPSRPAEGSATLIPESIPIDDDLRRLASLVLLRENAQSATLSELIHAQIKDGARDFATALGRAYLDAELYDSEGTQLSTKRIRPGPDLKTWLTEHGLRVLRSRFSSFERFAPSTGRLPKEAWIRFMSVALQSDICDDDSDDHVKLIREAYLVPMGLLNREGWYYTIPGKLDRHELVRLIMPLVSHEPKPELLYRHLAEPVYGLVPDQVHALLVFLVVQGEIDLIKSGRSYRDLYPTLPLPISYDRVVFGSGLEVEQLKALEILCAQTELAKPKQWTVTAQRNAVQRLSKRGQDIVSRLLPVRARLQQIEPECPLLERIDRHVTTWSNLDQGKQELTDFEAFCKDAGTVSRFGRELAAMIELPDRLHQLMGELKRMAYLLDDPGIREWPNPTVQMHLEALGHRPELDDLERVEGWIKRARATYREYCADYSRRHDTWWSGLNEGDILSWQPPRIVDSRHLGLNDALQKADELRQQATEQRCRSLSDLDFRSRCSCGFDGASAPIATTLHDFGQLRDSIDRELRRFFAQASVRERVAEWGSASIESTPGLNTYLKGESPFPEIKDVRTFDQHLAGLKLVAEVPSTVIHNILGERVWTRDALLDEIRRFLESIPEERLRFTEKASSPAITHDAQIWCLRMALQTGTPLPSSLSPISEDAVVSEIRPEWIGNASLARLEKLNLGEIIEDRIADFLVNGMVAPLKGTKASPLVSAALAINSGPITESAEELAEQAARLYRHHPRLWKVGGEQWLACLNAMAQPDPKPALPSATDALADFSDHQWLVIDCFGAPLIETLTGVLDSSLERWRRTDLRFAMVDQRTTTDAWYSSLAENNVIHEFSKLNAIDRLIHERDLDFAHLEELAAVEVKLALARIVKKLDATRPVLVFADHGFRLSHDGSGFGHGGSSTLERLIPVIEYSCEDTEIVPKSAESW